MISIPFSGSKRYSYKHVKKIVEENGYKTVLEPFGGSGVLSVNLYNDGLVEKAIINDFDHFFDDYEEYLDIKDWIVDECYKFGIKKRTGGSGKDTSYIIDGDKRIPIKSRVLKGNDRDFLQNLISKVDKKYWRLLAQGSNFCHSGVSSHETIKLNDFTNFERDLTTTKQRQYLKVYNECISDSLDYKDFIEKYKPYITTDTLLIIDPPYTGTAQKQYKEEFSDKRTQELVDLLLTLDCDFVFFNANEDDVKRWLSRGGNVEVINTYKSSIVPKTSRQDVMAFVRNTKH